MVSRSRLCIVLGVIGCVPAIPRRHRDRGRARSAGRGVGRRPRVSPCRVAAVTAFFAIGRSFLTLTPDGISWGRWLFRRRIGWEELEPGGPARAHPGARRLRLATRCGRRSVSTQVDVHPWFLADAIRWYVEHPEHRAGIGTQAEHDRLLRGLGVPA